ncbi:hypothetical protein IRJ41_016643 [Triplophysa rosa]|uniref:Uncharacterized protein n=1 Tax=Triplophysa rosa TaxID=992332 RepID=A0A9W8CAS1_TRIRA|nr:hypothetical protein IRJ41_016643 [Triplophysa rosa]
MLKLMLNIKLAKHQNCSSDSESSVDGISPIVIEVTVNKTFIIRKKINSLINTRKYAFRHKKSRRLNLRYDAMVNCTSTNCVGREVSSPEAEFRPIKVVDPLCDTSVR